MQNLTLLITGGGTGGHLAIAEALGEELGRRGIEVVYVGSVNGQDKQWFDKSNSSLGMQCGKILDFLECTDAKSANIPKNPKNLHSHTANTRIVRENSSDICHTEGAQATEVSQIKPSLAESSLDKNPQDSRDNLTQNDKTNSPSLAEGVRGRVDSNAELSLQDSENDRGTSLPATQVANECEARAGAVAKQNLVKIASNSKNTQLELQGDCHALDSIESNARNDEKNFLCRPEALAEVSLARKNNRDISGLSPQYDKDRDSHAEKSDLVYNDKKQKTQKGILLSLFVRGGKIISIENEIISLNQYFANDKKDDKILLDEIQSQIYTQAILNQYSSKLPIIPSEILLPSVEGLPCELLSDFLHSTQGRKIALNVPQIGIKAKILALAKANAKDLLKQHTQKLQQETTLLECVAEMLNLDSIPHRIEVFDTSHHSGKDCVGAMIVYENGEFVKSSYRRYLLSGSDEYSQMREMLIRRAKDFATTPPPNLWLIDGGKAQIALANEVLQSCGLSGGAIDIVGIAKEKRESTTQDATNINEKMLTLSTRTKSSKYANRAKGAASDTLYTLSNSFLLNSHDELLQFLQKLRDEAHRFAIAFHREKKKTNALQSTELKKRNLNQAQIKRLLSLMGSFERVQKLSDEEIANLLKSKRTTSKTNKHK